MRRASAPCAASMPAAGESSISNPSASSDRATNPITASAASAKPASPPAIAPQRWIQASARRIITRA